MRKFLRYLLLLLIITQVGKSSAQYVTINDTALISFLTLNTGCMVGNQLNTACAGTATNYSFDISYLGVRNTDGIQFFTLLHEFADIDRVVLTIPSWPPNVDNIQIGVRKITFPVFPQSLTEIALVNDSLTFLPTLPSGLLYLNCSGNLLTTLPNIPNGLSYLNCSENLLTAIPQLPQTLAILDYGDNNIQSCVLPSNLTQLNCGNNNLHNLPSLPANLLALSCERNPLYTLPTLPSSLTQINCYEDSLSAMPQLPATTTTLTFGGDNITNIDSFNSGITYLDLSELPVSVLPPWPQQLYSLSCRNNFNITSMPVFPPSLKNILVNGNAALQSIPALPDTVTQFDCSSDYSLRCMPYFNYVQVLTFSGTFGISCLPTYGSVNYSSPLLSSYPLCSILNNNNNCSAYWNISGRGYFDTDNNCLFNGADTGQQNIKIKLYNNGNLVQQIYTGGQGFYSFQSGYGNYNAVVDTTGLPFTLECPLAGLYNDTLSSTTPQITNNDFAFVCNPAGVDLGVNSMYYFAQYPRPAGWFTLYTNAGDMAQNYNAICAAGTSGTVQLSFNGPIAYDTRRPVL